MALTLKKPKFDSGVAYYRQTVGVLKEYIERNQMKHGDKLPSVRDLAKSIRISPSTLDKAMRQLQQEGLIDRQPGRGIFINDRLSTGELAVVLKTPLLSSDSWPWYPMVYALLVDALHKHTDIHCQVKMHSGSGNLSLHSKNFAGTLDLLDSAVLCRLRGVFTFHPLFEMGSELEKADVPIVRIGENLYDTGKYSVCPETSQPFYSKAVNYLCSTGARSVGLLWSIPLHHEQPKENRGDVLLVSESLPRGLQCRSEWMPYIHGNIDEQKGYELFMRFWQQQQGRPDAVIVADDVLCKGAMRAVLHLGLDLPRDIQLITASNRGIELPYHKSVTRLEHDTHEQVRLAVEMMAELLSGNTPANSHITIPKKLIEGQTTKPKHDTVG